MQALASLEVDFPNLRIAVAEYNQPLGEHAS